MESTLSETTNKLLSHSDEIRLANVIAKGKAASVKLAKGGASEAHTARLNNDIELAEDARTEFVMRNQGLIGKVARRYFDTGHTHEDLMQEGQIGLLKAIERYDPKIGTRFSTYAVWWIRQAVGRSIANTGNTIRMPVNVSQSAMQLRRTETVLTQELGRNPKQDEVAQRMQWTVAQVRKVTKSMVWVESLDEIISNKMDGAFTLQDKLSDETVAQSEKQTGMSFLKTDIEAAMGVLTTREASLLRMRFGFSGNEICPLSVMSVKFGMSREGIRQAVTRAMRKIKMSPYANGLREYCGGD